MRYLHRLQIILLVIIGTTLLSSEASGQNIRSGNYNFRDFQTKPYYFGLTLGYNSSRFQILNSNEFILNDSFNVLSPGAVPGFNVSIVTNLKLGRNFDFRFLPGFSFTERNLIFKSRVEQVTDKLKKIESIFWQMPFHVRFKSAPYRDMRMFVVGGVKYTYDVASNARIRKALAGSLIRISPHDFSLEVGAGMQFFFPYFIFSPEIKFSQGVGNILIYNNNLLQSKVIQKMFSRTFTVSLHFEG